MAQGCRAVARFIRAEVRELAGVFLVVVALVVAATLASALAWSGVGLIAFVPLVGLAVFPLQLAALLVRGLVFEYLGLTALGAYLTLYQGTRHGARTRWRERASRRRSDIRRSDCALRIADCGLRIDVGCASRSAIRNPQSAIRNRDRYGGGYGRRRRRDLTRLGSVATGVIAGSKLRADERRAGALRDVVRHDQQHRLFRPRLLEGMRRRRHLAAGGQIAGRLPVLHVEGRQRRRQARRPRWSSRPSPVPRPAAAGAAASTAGRRSSGRARAARCPARRSTHGRSSEIGTPITSPPVRHRQPTRPSFAIRQ